MAMRSFWIIAFCVILFFHNTSTASQTDSLEVKIDLLMGKFKDKPGGVIGIVDNGKLVFSKGYGLGNMRKGSTASGQTPFKIASVSKQFTAAVIQQLIKDGALSMDADIRKYIPEFPDYGKKITISNLLYHTSGIRDYVVLMWLTGISMEARFTNKDALSIIFRQQKLDFTTGYRCVYSNSNYLILAEIAEKVTGKTFNELSNNIIYKPLGMLNTGVGSFKDNKGLALSYKQTEQAWLPYGLGNLATGNSGMYTT
ncbi:MAG: class A beta-lactamase-related serine hydrolase, partial [Chitinophagaceae bacterium]